MVSAEPWVITVAVFVGVMMIFAFYKTSEDRRKNTFTNRHLLKKDMELPVIWIYYDNSDVNSRWWYDFGARSSRVLNLPFLNLCYQTIVEQNKNLYRIEIISGLSDLALRFGGWEALPTRLQNPNVASIREGELNWIRAAVLAKYGGLWLSPTSICLQGFGQLPTDKVVFYGSDRAQSFAGHEGTRAPAFNAVWSPIPAHPGWVEVEERQRKRLNNGNGGLDIRGDAKSDFVEIFEQRDDVEIRPNQELSRMGTQGKPIQLEDLLAAGQEGKIHFAVPSGTVFVSLPWPELRDRRMFGWFLRMSETQILESDLVISELFRQSLPNGI